MAGGGGAELSPLETHVARAHVAGGGNALPPSGSIPGAHARFLKTAG